MRPSVEAVRPLVDRPRPVGSQAAHGRAARDRKPKLNPRNLMTRNGKIARLPAGIREELNQRLFNGEQGKHLVEWLNGLPKVQTVMQAAFEGRPITEDNLSEWKLGGYLAWEGGQRLAEKLRGVLEGTDALQQVAKDGLTDRMALILAANLAL